MTIDLLCKVVDNYGDIGVVWRLARALQDLDPGIGLRIIIDDLAAFHALAPGLDPSSPVQAFHGLKILPWEGPAEVLGGERPRYVVECFACGRPDWYDEVLYDAADQGERRVVNLEYLSAEDYARDFHLMPSATRSALVRKRLFMPGFCAGTGGLIIDRRFGLARAAFQDPLQRPALREKALAAAGLLAGPGEENAFWVSVFSYERNYKRVVADLASWGRPVLALVAPGRSARPFFSAWEAADKPFPALALPFLAQEAWDDVLLASDFCIVRGEETLARAALSGRPFLWHAYIQDEGQHLVKVRALLDRMRPHFQSEAFSALEELFLAFNDRKADGPEALGQESFLPCLRNLDRLEPGFASFASTLVGLGDLASHLLTFFNDFV